MLLCLGLACIYPRVQTSLSLTKTIRLRRSPHRLVSQLASRGRVQILAAPIRGKAKLTISEG